MQRLNMKTIILLLFIPIQIMGQNHSKEEVIVNGGRSARFGFGGLDMLRDVWKQFCNRTCWGLSGKIFIVSRRLICAVKCPESANPNRPNQGSTTTALPESTTTQSTATQSTTTQSTTNQSTTTGSTVSESTTAGSTNTQSTMESTETQSTMGPTITTQSTTISTTLPSSTLPKSASTGSKVDSPADKSVPATG